LSGAIDVNCSESNQPALLKALNPVFNLKAIRPVMNLTTPTNIITYFTMYGILGVVSSALIAWSHFSHINSNLHCLSDSCSMDENTAPFVPYVYLYHDGKVHDALPVRIVSSCNLDIYTFPFDVQNCTMTFNSYIHFGKTLHQMSAENITLNSKNVITTTGEWELLEITSYKNESGQDKMRRRATLYVVNLLIPSCFLITVDLFSFLLPPQAVDRSSFKMTLILGYTVFLLIMNDLLPVTGNSIPLINVFFSLCLALMVTSLLETILITNLLNGSADFSPLPHWIRVIVLQFLGCVVCLPQKTKETKRFGTQIIGNISGSGAEGRAVQELRSLGKDLQAIRLQVEKQMGQSESSEEWIQVGFIIDRLLFGLYILFISVSFITIINIWVNSYSS
uniref:Neurotransmitter-gated ion-channel ligand-binding domain-containing protein n=1 Tax=Labrus bergylta TaxID=56723 RepID=A0A3Q3NGE0_9LABR